MTCEYCDYSEADCAIEWFDGAIGISCNACADLFMLGNEVLELNAIARITDIDKQLIQSLSACRLDNPSGAGRPLWITYTQPTIVYEKTLRNFEKSSNKWKKKGFIVSTPCYYKSIKKLRVRK